jgi:hypothetical protein
MLMLSEDCLDPMVNPQVAYGSVPQPTLVLKECWRGTVSGNVLVVICVHTLPGLSKSARL